MSPEKQRVLISYAWIATNPPIGWCTADGYMCIDHGSEMLDPLADLNAVHEAEKVLQARNLWDRYRETLIQVAGWKNFHSATAAQRAEAFLRTIGKWEVAS